MDAESSRSSLDRARRALDPIEHIVVLMLENRSFDHMLGYLALPEYQLSSHGDGEFPGEVDGLRAGLANVHDGVTYPPEPLDESVFSDKGLDPPHHAERVKQQIGEGGMGGFVSAFAGHLAERPEATDPEVLKSVMGHMTPDHVPVYDHLARSFCICDRWFCSVAGPTMPNRFFAVAGTTNGVVNNTDVIVGEFGKFKSFFRHLKPADWRWYSSDPGILRAIDEHYMFDNENDHFAYFDQHTEVQPRSFLRDILGDSERQPALPSVCWIDPNFAMSETIDLPITIDGPGSNDDHPPAPVINGQKLVNKVYEALRESRYRDTSLLIVMYDEHGGFFDHVAPPGNFGPRVPVLLVSSHVKRGVCSTPFDHAAVIKTILLRFGDAGSIGLMPESVLAANDLSVALRDDGMLVPFTQVPDAGRAAILPGDLSPAFLPNNGSTLSRALAFSDEELTDLQRDIIQGIAIPLRTGYKFLRRVREHRFLKPLVPLLTRFLKPGKRLAPRRP